MPDGLAVTMDTLLNLKNKVSERLNSVRMDLDLYKDLVRPGGHMLGDDWFHPPIKQAVADSLGEVITKSHDKFLWVKQ